MNEWNIIMKYYDDDSSTTTEDAGDCNDNKPLSSKGRFCIMATTNTVSRDKDFPINSNEAKKRTNIVTVSP